jgi:hypothetical protein
MTASRELIALRNYLTEALDAIDVTHLNMRAVADASEPALARGWTGRELAANAVAGVYSGGIESPGAYIVANLRDLGTVDPPREVTPQPPPVADVLADIHMRHTPATNPGQWVAKLRGTA